MKIVPASGHATEGVPRAFTRSRGEMRSIERSSQGGLDPVPKRRRTAKRRGEAMKARERPSPRQKFIPPLQSLSLRLGGDYRRNPGYLSFISPKCELRHTFCSNRP